MDRKFLPLLLSVFGCSCLSFPLVAVRAYEVNSDPASILIGGDDCSQEKEVNFHSQRLLSPDGSTSVYFDVSLRRNPSEREPYYGCRHELETIATNLVIELGRQDETIDLDIAALDVLVVPQPLSFSPDGRFLGIQVRYEFGYEYNDDVWIVDLDSGQLYINRVNSDLEYCRRTDELPYSILNIQLVAFSSPNEFLVKCSAYQGQLQSREWIEIVDIDTKANRTISNNFPDASLFGDIVSPTKLISY